jgi:cyanophycinase
MFPLKIVRNLFQIAVCCVAVFVVPKAIAETPHSAAQGSLVMVGGALRHDNTVVWQRIIQLAGGQGASIAVFASASANPAASGRSAVEALNRLGAQAFFVPLAVRLTDTDFRQIAADPVWVAKVTAAKGVFFTGGDQGRITQAMRQADGSPSPMLDAVWSVYRSGGVIAGTSAGTAIMSTVMFHDAMPVLATLKAGVGRSGVMAPGLGFLGPDVFADQHLLVRGRFARMLPAMLAHGYKLGVGVDENTAAVVTKGSQIEIVGYKGALIVDMSQASSVSKSEVLDIRSVKLSYLSRGDRYDLIAKALVLDTDKAQRKLDAAKPGHKTVRLYADILANTTVVDLMQNLIDSAQPEALGLALTSPGETQPELGFEFRFRKGADSAAYDTGTQGGEDNTVLNIYLDVRPVVVALPLYRLQTTP